jgi:hypothetical protein
MQENHSAVDKTANVVHNLLSAVGVVARIDRGFNDVTNSGRTVYEITKKATIKCFKNQNQQILEQ